MGKPGRRGPAAHRQGRPPEVNLPSESPSLRKPWRFNLYLYLGYVLARVCLTIYPIGAPPGLRKRQVVPELPAGADAEL
jgi:hypothetical protein